MRPGSPKPHIGAVGQGSVGCYPSSLGSQGWGDMAIELDRTVRDALARAVAAYLKDELDLEIGGMDAVLLIDFLSERLGPHYYNQALHDARALLHARVDALGDSFYELEKAAKL